MFLIQPQKLALRIFPILLPLIALGCDLKPSRGTDVQGEGVTRKKEVVVHSFTKLKGEAFNFNADVPDMLAMSDGILYTATTLTKNLHAFKMEQGNRSLAWAQLTDFTGSDALANFDLNTGTRVIERIAPMKGGVVVGVSENTAQPAGTPGAELGLAVFLGQKPKAEYSAGVNSARGSQGFHVIDLVASAAANGETVLYAIVNRRVARNDYNELVWLNLFAPTNEVHGGDGARAIKFPGPPLVNMDSRNNGAFALSAFTGGRIAVAKPAGLLTIDRDSVGKRNADNPVFEQDQPGDVLDSNHAEQWKSVSGRAATRVGAMALVGGKYLVIGFVDDGTGNSGMLSADVTRPSLIFSTNLRVPSAKVKKIVVDGGEARLVAGIAVYGFKDGLFSLLFRSATLTRDRAYIDTGVEGDPNSPRTDPVTFNNFRGGNEGEVPADGTIFRDAAPGHGSWFYATDKGIYEVKTRVVSKSF